jgi:hypothetical protein
VLGLNVRLGSVARRRVMLSFYALLLVAVALVVLIVVLAWSSSKHDDRLAVIANFFAGGTLILALLAGFVALQAYAAATGLPDLKLQFKVPSGHINEPRFIEEEQAGSVIRRGPQAIATIHVNNSSLYAARTPAVIVSLHEMAIGIQYQYIDPGWTVNKRLDNEDITQIQWDGGPNYSIHGKFGRSLPPLDLAGLYPFPSAKEPKFVIHLVADGYQPREIPLEAIFTKEGRPGVPPAEPSKKPDWL